MKKLFDKDEVTFAIINIVIYIVGASVCGGISDSPFLSEVICAVFFAVLTAVYIIFVKKNGLMEYFGLCKGRFDTEKWLFFIPMIAAATVNVWFGVDFSAGADVIAAGMEKMLFVGFLEEIIFRGFLFKGMAKSGVKSAVIVSSVTFGIGHIVNLLNGAPVFETLVQISYAVAIGFMLTVFFHRSGSLLPCIAFHSFVNMTSVIGAEVSNGTYILIDIVLMILTGGYAVYILKAVPAGKAEN